MKGAMGMKQKWVVGIVLIASIFIIAAYLFDVNISTVEQKSAKFSTEKEYREPPSTNNKNRKLKLEEKQQTNNHLGEFQKKNDEIDKAELSKSKIPPEKKVFLTFDDGPSPLTNEILAILNEKGVKATFFTIGNMMEQYPEIVKKTYDSGHMVLPHSYSHNYEIYSTLNTFYNDYAHVRNVYESILGFQAPPIFRFPGGSSNQVAFKYSDKQYMSTLTEDIKKRGYSYIDWNVISGDASPQSKNPSQMLEEVINGSHNHDMIVALFHDMKSNKEILEILPKVIAYYQQHSYKFRTFRDITDEEMGELMKRGIVNKQIVHSLS